MSAFVATSTAPIAADSGGPVIDDAVIHADKIVRQVLGSTEGVIHADKINRQVLGSTEGVIHVSKLVRQILCVPATSIFATKITRQVLTTATVPGGMQEPGAAVDAVDAVIHVVPLPADVSPNYATDVYLKWNPLLGGADFTVESDDLASHRDIVTSITLSLFCDRRAAADDELPNPFSNDRRGWWGSTYLRNDPNTQGELGSRLWLLSRSKSSPQLPITAKGYVQEALGWLTARGIASKVDIQTAFLSGDPSKLGIAITVYRQGQEPLALTYNYAWQQVAANPVY